MHRNLIFVESHHAIIDIGNKWKDIEFVINEPYVYIKEWNQVCNRFGDAIGRKLKWVPYRIDCFDYNGYSQAVLIGV